jgi:hypothetical protein
MMQIQRRAILRRLSLGSVHSRGEAMLTGMSPILILALLVLAIMLIVAWIVLPFAVIGTKPLLRRLLVEAERANELLEGLARPRA